MSDVDDLDFTGATVLTVQPGDKVLLVIRGVSTRSKEQVEALMEQLGARLPSIEWTIVAGVDEVVHVPA